MRSASDPAVVRLPMPVAGARASYDAPTMRLMVTTCGVDFFGSPDDAEQSAAALIAAAWEARKIQRDSAEGPDAPPVAYG